MKDQAQRDEAPAEPSIDDRARLDRERREQVADDASKIRAVPVAREVEPPVTYRP